MCPDQVSGPAIKGNNINPQREKVGGVKRGGTTGIHTTAHVPIEGRWECLTGNLFFCQLVGLQRKREDVMMYMKHWWKQI